MLKTLHINNSHFMHKYYVQIKILECRPWQFIYLFNLSVAGWHKIHLQPLYVKSLPENTSINFHWGSVLVSKCTHFPHTTTWEKFAAIGEECTHRKTRKVTLSWRIKGNLLCWYIPQLVNNEHNSFIGFVSQTQFLPWRKTVLQHTTCTAVKQLMFHTCF